ncbi:unnamed protein product [Urochloa decumbens]|uniref:F-box domain-containing protein n=1 Tax=Urochloa decumbens TaxID=240449 RepID=A0ABC9GBQ3_9POAL
MAPPPQPPPLRRPPELMEELVEEVLLRFPPDEPASLVRAALVSRRWCRLISGRGFRRRFRELHRAAPMLGFVCNILSRSVVDDSQDNARFVPISSCLPHADRPGWRALDARHGRVLLYRCPNFYWGDKYLDPFVVWDPVTGEELQLPSLPTERCYPFPVGFNAAVLCAGGGACGHLDCNSEPFLVVFVGFCNGGMVSYVYSSEAGVWSEPTIPQHPDDYVDLVPAAVVGNAGYFMLNRSTRILKYDLGTREMSPIDLPSTLYRRAMLMITDEGRLGFTGAEDFKLYLWSMEVVGPRDDVLWTQDRVIELRDLLPADVLLTYPAVVGYVNGHGAIFVGTMDGFYTIDLKSNQARKVGGGIACMRDGDVNIGYCLTYYYIVVPYTSFFFPGADLFNLFTCQHFDYVMLQLVS